MFPNILTGMKPLETSHGVLPPGCFHRELYINVCLRIIMPLRKIANAGLGCGKTVETSLHVLRDCVAAKRVWDSVIIANDRSKFYTRPLQVWLQSGVGGKLFTPNLLHNIYDVAYLFCASVWEIWKSRNLVIFQSKSVSTSHVLFKACMFASHHVDAFGLHRKYARSGQWVKPKFEWFKLNTDGGSSSALGKSVAGGLCRDANGKWCWGFTACLPFCDVLTVETFALKIDLNYAWEKRLPQVEIEVDSSVLRSLLLRETVFADMALKGLIEECVHN
ncbi:hypothetical protein OROGR_001224 [Orobanche gracilis]